MTKKKNIEDAEHMPPPEEAPPPATPDHSYIVVSLAGEKQAKVWLEQNTAESICSFLMEAAKRLAAEDPHWGYLQATPRDRKAVLIPPSAQAVAADTVLYDSTMQAVHIVKNALEKGKDASVQWLLLPAPKVKKNLWYPTAGEL